MRRNLQKAVTYPIADIFYSLQGEGHFVGYPMTFIRLAGCSVTSCHLRDVCDEAPWKMTERLTLDEILSRCASRIVCITGGEPTDHDLLPLVSSLRDMGKSVHLETSGVRSIEGIPLDWITVSPKTHDYIQRTGHTVKIVVLPSWSWVEVDSLDSGTQFFHRYLQPLTNPDGSTNLVQVLNMLQQPRNHDGRWALSTQSHKSWSVK